MYGARYTRARLERRREIAEERLKRHKKNPEQAAYAEAALQRIDARLEALDAALDGLLESPERGEGEV